MSKHAQEEFREEDERAASLDIDAAQMRELVAQFEALTSEYFAHLTEMPVFPDTSAEELAQLFRRPLPLEAEPLEKLVEDARACVAHSRQNGHPRMFGYIASPSTPVGAFANLLASALNQNVTSWRSSPAATVIEQTTVRWLAQMIGYGENCGGLLTSGGSMANLNAIFVAHRARGSQLRAGHASRKGLWNAGAPATLYVSDQVHLSIPKAADVLGLGREQVRVVHTDDEFRMDVRALRERIVSDRERGLRPFCIVASAGTVATGAVDPLAEAAAVAREHSLWFHIDGAYGALSAADAAKRQLFEGLELADSVSLDPHKWLYAPVDCGCLLLRRPEDARAAFSGTEDSYIKVLNQSADESFAFWDYGVELSRPFRAFKVWLMIRYYGARRISRAIQKDNALALYMSEQVSAAEDLELLAPVTLSICCFRYVPPRMRRALDAAGTAGDEEERARLEAQVNELNERIMQRVQRGGRAYLSNANLRGRFALRAAITNFRTTREDIRITLDAVRRAAAEG